MTELLVGVADAAQAEQALEGGADRLDVLGSIHAIKQRFPSAPLIVQISNLEDARAALELGAEWIACPLALALDGAALASAYNARCGVAIEARERAPFQVLGQLAKAGVQAAILQSTSERLLSVNAIAEIAGFIQAAKEAGLRAGAAGRLQAPDIPRLLALKPDFLSARSAFLSSGEGLDSRELRLFRALITAGEENGRTARGIETDLVFVRDYIIPMSIGAYAHERGVKQRVRFNVEALVRRRPREDDDLANLFSYDVITDAIARLSAGDHFALVETLAEKLAQSTLADPHVAQVRVKIEKLDVIEGSVGVEIVRFPEAGRRA